MLRVTVATSQVSRVSVNLSLSERGLQTHRSTWIYCSYRYCKELEKKSRRFLRRFTRSVRTRATSRRRPLSHKASEMLAVTFLAGSSGFTGAGPALVAPRPQVQFAGRPLLAVEMSAARRAHLGALVSGLTSLATLGAAANAAEIRSTPWAMSTFRACAALRIRHAAPTRAGGHTTVPANRTCLPC